jgi:hypothetical protein
VTLRLTPEQEALYDEGFWPSQRLYQDLIEALDRAGVTEPVAVLPHDESVVLFWLSATREII